MQNPGSKWEALVPDPFGLSEQRGSRWVGVAAAAHLCQQVRTEPGATGTWDFLPAFNTEAAGSTVIRVFLNGESILITQKD